MHHVSRTAASSQAQSNPRTPRTKVRARYCKVVDSLPAKVIKFQGRRREGDNEHEDGWQTYSPAPPWSPLVYPSPTASPGRDRQVRISRTASPINSPVSRVTVTVPCLRCPDRLPDFWSQRSRTAYPVHPAEGYGWRRSKTRAKHIALPCPVFPLLARCMYACPTWTRSWTNVFVFASSLLLSAVLLAFYSKQA
jgi:hypothetical protein